MYQKQRRGYLAKNVEEVMAARWHGQPRQHQTAAKPVLGHALQDGRRRTPRRGEVKHIDGDRQGSVDVCERRARAVEEEIVKSTRMRRCVVTRRVDSDQRRALERPEAFGARRRPWRRHGRHKEG
jgi:hypothetical protein